jgi:hypothetical protein
MRSLIQSILAFVTLGMIGSNKSEAPIAPTDVTLHVPGMF